MLEIDRLTRRFGTKVAVDDVSLSIQPGSFVGVIGRSGAGKSTLLRMINRLQTPSEGAIRWRDQDVTRLRGQDLRDWRMRCAMVFQQFNIVGRLDVMTNVLMGRLNHTSQMRSLLKLWSPADRTIAVSALDMFDITSLAGQRAESLSGGQQQRVAIARALVNDPALILADEPTGALDSRTSLEIMALLQQLNRGGITVVVVTHEQDIAAYAGRLIGFRDGRVRSDVRQSPRDAADDLAARHADAPEAAA
jgi:phosphonate transport system ATP-binding protein